MENTKPTPEEIIKQLESSKQMVPIGTVDGLLIEATIDDENLIFHHRLDAFSRPSQQQALATLTKLNTYYEALRSTSERFRMLVDSRRFSAELYIFSGQMDFSVATMDEVGVKWHVDLNK
jgi:hypothetical protein